MNDDTCLDYSDMCADHDASRLARAESEVARLREQVAEERATSAPLPTAEEPAKPSTPVTFAAILAHHRRLAEDPRADRSWHSEAVAVLVELAGELSRACDEETCGAAPYDGGACHGAECPVWMARKAVEGEG